MNTDADQIRAQVEALLADLPSFEAFGDGDAAADFDVSAIDVSTIDVSTIDAVGRRLAEAHQILVDALESVEKG